MNCIDHYTTVSILTKVSNDKTSDTFFNDENKSSYHILKHPNNDKVCIIININKKIKKY